MYGMVFIQIELFQLSAHNFSCQLIAHLCEAGVADACIYIHWRYSPRVKILMKRQTHTPHTLCALILYI
jgi:hypothetical protein